MIYKGILGIELAEGSSPLRHYEKVIIREIVRRAVQGWLIAQGKDWISAGMWPKGTRHFPLEDAEDLCK